MEILRLDNPKSAAGDALNTLLMRHRHRPILLMLSGGSALSLLAHISDTVLGPHLTATVLDERCSTDTSIQNFAQLERTTFFQHGVQRGMHTISTKIDITSNANVQTEWEYALREWKQQHPPGICIATIGIGPDGHIAGIFGGTYFTDFHGDAWTARYSVPKEVHMYTDRMTTTYTFLTQQVDEAIVYATGMEKQSVIKSLEDTQCTTGTMPACALHQLRSATLFTDIDR